MLNKEIRDILKLFIGTILVVLITLGLAFSMIRLLVDETFPFVDFAPLLLYITLMAISFYMGISLFAEEKNERAFEYLFSLRYSLIAPSRSNILFSSSSSSLDRIT